MHPVNGYDKFQKEVKKTVFNKFVSKLPNNLTFDEVLERLSANPKVDGVIVMGSAAKDKITKSSDFDICVVLAEPANPIWLVFTEVEQRVSEFYFIDTAFVQDHLIQSEIEAKADLNSYELVPVEIS